MAYKNVGLAHMWMARVGEWVGEGLVQSHLGPRAQAHVRYAYLCIVAHLRLRRLSGRVAPLKSWSETARQPDGQAVPFEPCEH